MLIMSTINLSLHIVKTQKKMRWVDYNYRCDTIQAVDDPKIISLASFSLYQLAYAEDRVHCWWYELQGTYSNLDNVYLNVIVGLMLFFYYIQLYFCFQVLLCIIRALWDVKRINMKYLFFISSLFDLFILIDLFLLIYSFIYLFISVSSTRFKCSEHKIQCVIYNV